MEQGNNLHTRINSCFIVSDEMLVILGSCLIMSLYDINYAVDNLIMFPLKCAVFSSLVDFNYVAQCLLNNSYFNWCVHTNFYRCKYISHVKPL